MTRENQHALRGIIFVMSLTLTGTVWAANRNAEYAADTKTRERFLAERRAILAEVGQDRPNLIRLRKLLDAHYTNYPGAALKQVERWYWAVYERSYKNLTGAVGFNSALQAAELRKRNARYAKRGVEDRGEWTEIGPFLSNTMAGRVDVIKIDPNDDDTIWIGTPTGGPWKSTDGGDTWEPMGHTSLPTLGVSEIQIHPDDSDLVFLCTGDKNHQSYIKSNGVYKSTDGGTNWIPTGLTFDQSEVAYCRDMKMKPGEPDTMIAATSKGLYRTTDAGENWDKVLDGSMDDFVFKPDDPQVAYTCTHVYRPPNDQETTDVYKTTDSGVTWNKLSVSTTGRTQIAVTPAEPNSVWVASAYGGIKKSTNGGDSFSNLGGWPGGDYQCWYDMTLAVSQTNPSHVHAGAVQLYRSTNGGQSFSGNQGGCHVDIHEMMFVDDVLYMGCDGHASIYRNGSWNLLTKNINIRQFFRFSNSQRDGTRISAGAQDNGSGVIDNGTWDDRVGADGMETIISHANDSVIYYTMQNGSFTKSSGSITQPGAGRWITPYVMHPTDADTLWVANDRIVKTTNGMGSWQTLFDFPGDGSSCGGSAQIVRNCGNAIAVATSNPDYLYAAMEGRVWRTKNGGSSWDEVSAGLPGEYVTYIHVNPNDESLVGLSVSGYADGNKVFLSDDAGDSWTNISGSLPNLPANTLYFDDRDSQGIYVGMDAGVYYRDNTIDDWVPFFKNLPNAMILELEIFYGEPAKLRAATYGRGFWETDLFTSAVIAEFSHEGDPTVEFTNESQCIHCAIAANEWDFGDGQTSDETDPSHTYQEAGTYTVTLTVESDDNTTDTVSHDVTVESGGDSDSDSDSDGDTDGDTDSDGDGDTDSDNDADSDADGDADGDGDGDGDGDSDIDGDADTDDDDDNDASDDDGSCGCRALGRQFKVGLLDLVRQLF